ncbi:MAG: YkgJ family cysteine cluster protein [Methylophilales bacterium]|nr:YkgJ family cysteine cluster protein [Methylophilales bacterium]
MTSKRTIPVLSVEQRQHRASLQLDDFFHTVPSDIREKVQTLSRRISQMNARITVKLQEILRTADQIFGYAGKYAACARGCGHCCHVHVPISDFEAEYIAHHVGTKALPLKQSIHHDRMEYSGKTPCVFLKNGECSIYEARPLTCRMHLNFDIDSFWCQHENWNNPEAAIPRPDIHPLMEAYHMLAGKSEPVVADIRDYFPRGKNT